MGIVKISDALHDDLRLASLTMTRSIKSLVPETTVSGGALGVGMNVDGSG